MTTTKAHRYFETLITDLESRASKATGEERARLIAAAGYYRARQRA